MVEKQDLTLEITVISAQGLKKSGLFSPRLQTFVTLSTNPPPLLHARYGVKHIYRTRVDDKGSSDPTWHSTICLPITRSFFLDKDSAVYAEIFTKSLIGTNCPVGWCKIPVTDVHDGFRPVNSVRYLSYRVRDPDGVRGRGVIDLSLRLVGSLELLELGNPNRMPAGSMCWPHTRLCQMAIGVPVGAFHRPKRLNAGGVGCSPSLYQEVCRSLGESSGTENWAGQCINNPH